MKCRCFTTKWKSRTSSMTKTRRLITSRVPAETDSPSRRRTLRTERRWQHVRAARSSLKSSTTRSCSCLEKSSRLQCRRRANWSWLSPDLLHLQNHCLLL